MKLKAYTAQQAQLIHRAHAFAAEAHLDQKRDDGTPYITHPELVADLIKQVTDDPAMIAAAYLHDTIEDTDVTYEDILERFGKDVADLVHEVTHEGDDTNGHYFPRLHSERGVMLKFADRLSNLSTMGGAWPEKRRKHYLKKSKFWKSEPKNV